MVAARLRVAFNGGHLRQHSQNESRNGVDSSMKVYDHQNKKECCRKSLIQYIDLWKTFIYLIAYNTYESGEAYIDHIDHKTLTSYIIFRTMVI